MAKKRRGVNDDGKNGMQPGCNRADRLRKYQWPKGTSGNPAGKKRGQTFTTLANKCLAADGGKGLQELVDRVLAMAKKGNPVPLRELLLRIDPPPKTDGVTVNVVAGNDMLEMLGKLKAATGFVEAPLCN